MNSMLHMYKFGYHWNKEQGNVEGMFCQYHIQSIQDQSYSLLCIFYLLDLQTSSHYNFLHTSWNYLLHNNQKDKE
jgi:diphthamide biosynthesis methyltransferase